MLTGSEVYARYGSAIAALGDLDMDGYNGRRAHTHLDEFLFLFSGVRPGERVLALDRCADPLCLLQMWPSPLLMVAPSVRV